MSFTLNSQDPNPFTGNAAKVIYEAMVKELKEDRNATIQDLVWAGGNALVNDPAFRQERSDIEGFDDEDLGWMAGVAYALKER